MDNSDNNSLDLSQMSPISADIKLNINRRSLSVYEQYLKQVTQSMAREQQAIAVNDELDIDLADNKLSAAQSSALATEDELADQNGSFANSQTAPFVEEPVPLVSQIHSKNLAATGKSPFSSKLLTIIMAFCALLLVSVLVIVFNANSSLMAMTDRLSSVNNQMSAVNDNISVIGQETALANAQAIADEKAANAANTARLASVDASLNTIASNINPIEYKSTAPATTRLRSMNIGAVDEEPAISYDDFKNESQATLYRESK